MTDLETIVEMLRRLKRTKKFKDNGFNITQLVGCGDSTTIEIDDNRNPGHSFELIFDKTGKLNNMDFGF